MDVLRHGARFLSRGMRAGNGWMTLLGAALVARGVIRWLDGPDEELVYSRRIEPGERIAIGLERPDA